MARFTGSLVGLGLALVAAGGLTSAGQAAGAATVKVVGSGTGCASLFCFQPPLQAAQAGDTVTWANTTAAPHTVTRCDTTNCSGQGPGTGADALAGSIAPTTGSYAHTFSGVGTYFYYCSVHGYAVMHAEVNVAAPAPNVPEAPSPLLIGGAGLLAVVGAITAFWRRQPRPVS